MSKRDRPVTAREAEKLLGIPASTIRTWWERRTRTGLRAAGADSRGRPKFRQVDLIALRDRNRLMPSALRNWGSDELGRKLSPAEAQQHLGIPEATVRTWYERRERTKLHPIGHDPAGRMLFAEVDLVALRLKFPVRDVDGERPCTIRDLQQRV